MLPFSLYRTKTFRGALTPLFLLISTATLPAQARDREHPEYEIGTRHAVSTRGLVAAWRGDGDAADRTGRSPGEIHGGVTFVPAMVGRGFYFNGTDGGINVPDTDSLKLDNSLTISAWVNVESFPTQAQGAGMILFRGDDRPGLDPYYLQVDPAHRVSFTVDCADGRRADVAAPIPAGRFVLVTATLDHDTGRMCLYENGELVAETTTTCTPLRDLDAASNPSLGIGYAQGYPRSGFRYAFHGVINELLVYKRALSSREIRNLYRDRADVPALRPVQEDTP